MEALLLLKGKARVSLMVGCLIYAVGKQPSIPLNNFGENGRLAAAADNDDDTNCFIIINRQAFQKIATKAASGSQNIRA